MNSFPVTDSKMHRLLTAIAAVLILLPPGASAASPAKTDGSESLGSKLLDDLAPSTAEKTDVGQTSSTFPYPAANRLETAGRASSPLRASNRECKVQVCY